MQDHQKSQQSLCFLIILFMLTPSIAFCSFAFAIDKNTATTFIPKKEWLNQDLAIIDQIKNVVSWPPITQAKIVAAFGNPIEQQLGFGLSRVSLGKAGGYTSVSMQLLIHNKQIIAMRCIQSGSDSFDKLISVLKERWKREPIETTNWSMTLVNQVNTPLLDKILSSSLGKSPQIKASPELNKAFQTLVSPFDSLMVGETGGLGAKTPGHSASNTLVNAKQYDLLRSALRGPNPEGRAFAALALIKTHQANEDDKHVIEKLKKLDLKLSTGEGCTDRQLKTFAEILK